MPDTPPSPTDPADGEDEDKRLVAVYLTNGTRTSAGPGPGVKLLPPDEAGRLVSARLAAYGKRPPRGYANDGVDVRSIGLMLPRNG